MTWSQSGWYTETLHDVLTDVTQTGNPNPLTLTGADAYMYLSLLSSSPTAYTDPVAYGGSAPNWDTTDEVTGTNWSTGGVQLSTAAGGSSVTTTLTRGGSGPYTLIYSWTNALSVASTTISTAIYGCIIYFEAVTTSSHAKPNLLALYFGTGYTTVSGTFGITPSGSGLSVLTLTG